MSTELEVVTAEWPRDEEILRRLRETVFIREQGVPREIEWDGRDGDAVHVIARRAGDPVGCGRLLPDGKIGRMAVLGEARGRGIGAVLLAALVASAQRRGLRRVYLHAQRHAAGFYARQGFEAVGEPFLEADIEHVAMQLAVSFADCRVPVAPVAWPSPFDELLLALARSARRDLAILSPRLDPAVFEAPALTSALTALCRRSRNARVRILVADGRAITGRGHALLALARRLPSSIALRELEEHPEWPGDCVVLRDRDGVLQCPADARSSGSYGPDDRPRSARELERFELLWNQGRELPDFRALHL